jgi:uncharacterized protein (TIGR02246 family)
MLLASVAGLATALILGCASAPRAATQGQSLPQDEATVRSFAKSYARSFQSGEAGAVLALMTDDFVALTPGKPPVVGKEAVRREITADLEELDVRELRFEPAEIEIRGDWAWTWGRSEAVMTTRGTGDDIHVTGKYLWILRRHADGTWRIARDSAHGN